MSRRVIPWIVVIVVVMALMIIPWTLWAIGDKTDQEEEIANALQLAFAQRYGTAAQLLGVSEPQSMYVFYWRGSDAVHATLWIDGLWVELTNAATGGEPTEGQE